MQWLYINKILTKTEILPCYKGRDAVVNIKGQGLAQSKQTTNHSISIKDLLEAGAHFGHQTTPLEPKNETLHF